MSASVIAVTLGTAAVALPSTGRADDYVFADPPVPVPAHPPRVTARVGPEASVYVGAGSFTNPSAPAFIFTQNLDVQRVGLGPGGIVALGWRVLPWLSVGGRIGYQYASARNLPSPAMGGKTDLFNFGVYVHAYLGGAFGWRWFDPWIGVGFDPSSLAFVETQFPQTRTVLTVYSVGLPISAGFDVNINPEWSVGVMAQGSAWFPYARCGDVVEAQMTACRYETLDVATSWFAGAGVRFTMPQSGPNW